MVAVQDLRITLNELRTRLISLLNQQEHQVIWKDPLWRIAAGVAVLLHVLFLSISFVAPHADEAVMQEITMAVHLSPQKVEHPDYIAQVIHATFSSPVKKMAFNLFVFFYQRVLNKDPLGMILSKLGVIEVRHGLLYLDLNKYLIKSDKAMRTLRKVNVNHATLREGCFVLKANINLEGVFASLLKSGSSSGNDDIDGEFSELDDDDEYRDDRDESGYLSKPFNR